MGELNTVAFIADPHMGGKDAVRNLRLVVDQLNVMPNLKAVIVVGDLTIGITREQYEGWFERTKGVGAIFRPLINGVPVVDHGMTHEEEFRVFREVMGLLTVPYFTIPGNHDWFTIDSPDGVFDDSMYRAMFGDRDITHQAVRVGSLNFIGIDSGPPEVNISDMKGRGVTQADLDAIRSLAVQGLINIVLIHHPVDATRSDAYSGLRMPTIAHMQAEFRAVCKEAGIAHVLSGHTHRWESVPLLGTSILNTQFSTTLKGEYGLVHELDGSYQVLRAKVDLPEDKQAREAVWQWWATRIGIASGIAGIGGFLAQHKPWAWIRR